MRNSPFDAFDEVGRLREAVPGVLLSTAALGAAALVAQQQLALGGLYVAIVVGCFLAGAAVALGVALRHLQGAFGAANQVTLFRGGLIALVAGLLVDDGSGAVLWFAVTVAAAALALDGVDGMLARRRGLSTPFGARFDMETDALSILVLATLVWHFDKAGAWVLLSALLRYAFVAAGRAWPWLRVPLPPSGRRKTVCVVQIGALLLCLVPFVSSDVSRMIAAAALALLTASFAADVAWLAKRGERR